MRSKTYRRIKCININWKRNAWKAVVWQLECTTTTKTLDYAVRLLVAAGLMCTFICCSPKYVSLKKIFFIYLSVLRGFWCFCFFFFVENFFPDKYYVSSYVQNGSPHLLLIIRPFSPSNASNILIPEITLCKIQK